MQRGDVRALLLQQWGIDAAAVDHLAGGMNSRTWEVTSQGRRWVLKLVTPEGSPGFRAGLHAAAVLEAAGLPAGAPVLTRDVQVAVEVREGTAALLTWVEGEALVGSLDDVEQIGRVLARTHSILRDHAIPGAPAFGWVDCDAPHLEVESWVRPAVRDAVTEWQSTRRLVPSWGYLHGDPAPEVFRHDRDTNVDGIIDWASGIHGPLLYDLASASMYVGDELTPALVEAYAAGGVVPRSEIDRGLHALQRYRYAVQADYFARRLHANDVTGIDGPAENWKGLEDARAMLGV